MLQNRDAQRAFAAEYLRQPFTGGCGAGLAGPANPRPDPVRRDGRIGFQHPGRKMSSHIRERFPLPVFGLRDHGGRALGDEVEQRGQTGRVESAERFPDRGCRRLRLRAVLFARLRFRATGGRRPPRSSIVQFKAPEYLARQPCGAGIAQIEKPEDRGFVIGPGVRVDQRPERSGALPVIAVSIEHDALQQPAVFPGQVRPAHRFDQERRKLRMWAGLGQNPDDVVLELPPHQSRGPVNAPVLGIEARVLSRALFQRGEKSAGPIRGQRLHLALAQHRMGIRREAAGGQGRAEARNPGVEPAQRGGNAPARAEQRKDTGAGGTLGNATGQPCGPEIFADRAVQAEEAPLPVGREQPCSERVGGRAGEGEPADIGNVQEPCRGLRDVSVLHAHEIAQKQRRADRTGGQQKVVLVAADRRNDARAAVMTEHRAAPVGEELGAVPGKSAPGPRDLAQQAQVQRIHAGADQRPALQLLQESVHLDAGKLALQERTGFSVVEWYQVERLEFAAILVLDPRAIHGFAPLGAAAGHREFRFSRPDQLTQHCIESAAPAGRRDLVEAVHMDTSEFRQQ